MSASKRALFEQMERDKVGDWIADNNPEALLADGFEDAIIGMADRCGQPRLVVYDVDKCIQILVERDGMTHEEAHEYFSFNTLGAWHGDMTPLFLHRPEELE